MSKILFTVVPAAGHMNPTVAIAQALQTRGHEVCYITGQSKVAMLQRAGLTAHSILRGRADTVEQFFSPVGANVDTYNPLTIFTWIQYFLNLIQDGLAESEQIIAEWQPDLLITDFSTPLGVALANRNHLPWITSCTVPSCIRTSRGTPIFLGGLSRPRHVGHHLRDWGGRQLHEMLRIGLHILLQPYWQRVGIQLNLANGGDGLYSPYAILGLAPKELEYPRSDWPTQLHWCGHIDWSDATTVETATLTFLKSEERKIFVTFGSEKFATKEKLLRLIAHALAGMGVSIVITGGGTVDLANLRLPNVHVLPYAPYASILSQVDLVVHHGGSGITYSTLAAGKPALIIPDGKDQPDNAQKVVELGAGLRLGQRVVTGERVKSAVERLLNEAHFTEAAQHMAASMARYRPLEKAVEVIEGLV